MVSPPPKSHKYVSLLLLLLVKVTVRGAQPSKLSTVNSAFGIISKSNLKIPLLQPVLLFVADQAPGEVGKSSLFWQPAQTDW